MRLPTGHVVGYIIRHDHLATDVGEPYLGSALRTLDLDRWQCRNERGGLVALVGDPLRPGRLPREICAVQLRAESEWNLRDPVWGRMELAALAALVTGNDA